VKFTETEVVGVTVVDLEPIEDERGFFARVVSEQEFEAAGLHPSFLEGSVSFNTRRGTLRGLHYQAEPVAEDKLVRCTAGALYDVAVDLRPGSPTFRRWTAVELSAERRNALFIPKGCAHGFETLADATEVSYLMSASYHPELARGVRWDDPSLAIPWPIVPPIVSSRDATLPLLDE